VRPRDAGGVQQSLKARPRVTAALATPIKPLVQEAFALVRETGKAGIVANDPVVVPIPSIRGGQGTKELR
jgi:hypothetical protein